VRQKLNEIKRARDWIGINWIGESSTLSGIDGVAWYGMRGKNHPKQVSMGELDDKIREFYKDLSNALTQQLKNPIIDENEQLSIPELIKRFVTLYPIKSNLKANNFPNIEIPNSFQDISRQKEKDSNNNNEENCWTGWFQGDGDKIGDYLKSLVDQGNITEGDALHQFSTALINWGQNFCKELPPARDTNQTDIDKDGRIIYAGGDDFLGVLYRNYNPKLTGRKCLEWFYNFGSIWRKYKDYITSQEMRENNREITVSVGFIWAAPSVPQRDVLEHGREAEQSAKKNGRDRLAIRILFNSGNYIEWCCPWRLLKPIMSADVVNWIHFYKDVATLEARHGFENQKEVAIALFDLHFPNLEETLNLADQQEWFNGEKTGILGEKINYQNQDESLDYSKVNNALNNWVINLAKVGFHLRENEAEQA
jgi:CRISPR-associated protein Cmr2